MLDHLLGDGREVYQTHKEDDGVGCPGLRYADLGPIDRVHAMTGDKCHGGSVVAMRQRNAGIRGQAERRGYAGNNFEGNVRRGQSLNFLAAAPENEWIAALEADDGAALLRAIHHQRADFLLRHFMPGTFFADVDALGVRGRIFEQLLAGEAVVEHAIGARKRVAAFDGD